ncbi:hypothetical protein FXN61_16720 [Lentzea sp. PSKA42]|uniref:S-adenosyl methyltransferase n=1 Tax=Lentzea indica TaxID=2604800 RepID=A0ABX1FIE5_9PSEU|nr:SAM-dependent methyltransferase [Lentzea indica]NKE58378.1 hypothetical protein [Lentzea indica]
MTEGPVAPSSDIDLTRPSAARVYDYYLGGAHNFAVDREMAQQAIAMWPDLPLIMQANRAFLRRAVRFCVAQGIRQFLDLGSGIPTVGNVHEAARRAVPDARVVYVDSDPIAVTHSRNILDGDELTAVVHADLRHPDTILSHPDVRSLLDLDQPIAVMMVAVLHFVPDSDDPAKIIASYRDAMAPGSFLVVSHASQDGQPVKAGSHQDLYRRTPTPMTMRSRPEVTALFDGFDLVDPGVVFLPLWRPESLDDVDEHPERFTGLAAVGRKPR